MKSFLTCLIIGFISLCIPLNAQFTAYLAFTHIETARVEAEKSLVDPQLISIITMNGSIPNILLPLVFDYSETEKRGTSSAWAYCFNSAENPDTIVAFLVADITFQGEIVYKIVPSDANVQSLFEYVSTNGNLDNVECLNSDAMLDYLLPSSQYQGFMEDNPEGSIRFVSLVYSDFEWLEPETPYWFVTVESETDTTLIIMNAINGEITGVKDSETNIFSGLYPNPTNDIINLRLPADISNLKIPYPEGYSLKIYDISGNEMNFNQISSDAETMRIDVSNLVSGYYIISYISNGNKLSGTFRISR